MIGRGLICHPDLAEAILHPDSAEAQKDSLSRFRHFHDLLLSSYVEEMPSIKSPGEEISVREIYQHCFTVLEACECAVNQEVRACCEA
jgi:hypothetical protein